MIDERELQTHPIVPDSVAHNTKVRISLASHRNPSLTLPQTLSDIRSLTGSIFGVAAGILGLESASGFLFYILGSLLVSALVFLVLAKGNSKRYFQSMADVWISDVFGGLSGFILTWTLFFGLVRA